MNRLEANLVGRAVRWLRTTHPSVWWLKVHGGPYQRAGIPDLLLCCRGRLLAVEFKAPGEAPTRLQALELASLAEAGAATLVCASLESFVALVTAAV